MRIFDIAANPISESWREGRFWSACEQSSSQTHGTFSFSFEIGDTLSRTRAGEAVSKSWRGNRICSHKYRPYVWLREAEIDWMEIEMLRRDR